MQIQFISFKTLEIQKPFEKHTKFFEIQTNLLKPYKKILNYLNSLEF